MNEMTIERCPRSHQSERDWMELDARVAVVCDEIGACEIL